VDGIGMERERRGGTHMNQQHVHADGRASAKRKKGPGD
jgi:hypothetical protein